MKTGKNLKRLLSLIMAIAVCLSVMPALAAGDTTASVAEWKYTAAPENGLPAAATGGTDAAARLTLSGATYTGYSSKSLAANAWSEDGYWLMELDTSGYKNLTFSAQMRSSNTGPADFKLQYRVSASGQWTDVDNGAKTIPSTTLQDIYTDVSLPAEAENCATLQLRLLMADTVSVNGGTVAATGVSNINNIVISGSASGSDPAPVTVETPSAAYSEAEGTVTFTCATGGVTYYYSVNGGEYTALAGNVLDVSGYESGTVISYYAELSGVKSAVGSVTITVTASAPAGYTRVTSLEELTSGGDFVLVANADGAYKALDTVTGSKINAVDVTVSGDTVTSENPPTWTVENNGDGVNLYNGTSYLGYGSSTNFTSGSEAYLWTVTANEDGTFRFTASGSATRAIAYGTSQAKFGAYSTTNSSGYVFDLLAYRYGSGNPDVPDGPDPSAKRYAKLDNEIQDGDQLIVYYNKDSLVMGLAASGKGLAGVSAEPNGEFIEVAGDMAVLTAEAQADGSFRLVSAQGQYLTSGATGNSLSFEAEAGEYSTWTVNAVTGGVHLVSVNAEYNGAKQALEIYNGVFTTFTEKTTDYYLFNLYTLTDEAPEGGNTPDEPGGDEGTGYRPASGDTVAIYYPAGGLVMTGAASGTRLVGAAATVSGNTLYTDGSELMLKVTVDENGRYTFTTEDGKYLTSTASSSLTLADTASDYSLWELEEAEGGWYIKNYAAVYGTSPQYIEYYSGFTTYSLYSGGAIYTMRFFKNVKSATVVDSDLVYDIAQWGGGGPYDESNSAVIYGDKYEVGDMKDTSAAFTVVANGAAAQPYQRMSTSTGGYNYYMGGANIGAAAGDYMQFALSTAGWGAMSLSFRLRATNAAPGSFQVQFSTDGGSTFSNFTTGEYSYAYTRYTADGTSDVTGSGTITDGIAKTSLAPTYYVSFRFDVPMGAEDAEELIIRLVPGTERANGAAGTPSGNIRIDSVILSGSPIVDEGITGYVKVTPDGIEEDQPAGTELTMTSATEGAKIFYRFVNIGDGSGEWKTYDGANRPVLPALPAVLEVYASSEGRADSVTRILQYAAGTVQAVKMTPNGGGVYIEGDSVEVVLSTATEGATIYYSIETDSDGNDLYQVYDRENAPILLEKGFEKLTVKAYATFEGFKDSAVTTRVFTERAQQTYNIYFGQMHSHTSYSDGAGTAKDAYEHATGVENLDFLAVTDHSNSFDNADASALASDASAISEEWKEGKMLAQQYTTDTFVGLFGFEMTWSNGLGHINTFNTPGFQSRTQSAYTTYSTALQNYYATLKTVSDSISQFNHPGTTFGDFSDFSYYDEEIDNLITLIEVGNGEGAIGSSGYFPSYEYYTRALDKGWHVAPTNNQDNHKGLWGDSNTARSVVLADTLTEADIYDAMRNYRVYATEDNDLSIYYTLDGNIMGTILTESDVDDTVTLTARISDPTDSAIGTVQVIVNGGLVAASQTVTANSDTVTFEIPNNYSYYYLKVVEPDGDIAVTAPVWVGAVEAVGISTFTTDAALAVQNQSLNLNLELYNNEKTDFLVESIVFTLGSADGEVIETTTSVDKIAKMGTASYSFAYTHPGLGATNIYATVTGTLNGVAKVYTELLQLNYVSQEMVTRVIVDGTHYNDYVTGYYGGNMGNFTAIAAGKAIEVSVVTDAITEETLADCALLVISAPARKSGTANAGDYTASVFEDSFIELVAQYVSSGGSVVICGLADYQDKSAVYGAEGHASAQMNKLLEAIGSTMRINDDEVYDPVSNGGQFYRLYPSVFNTESPWIQGVVEGQVYSQYSGCSVDVGNGTWLVRGFETTYSVDSDKDGVGNTDEIETDDSYGYNIVTPKGEVVFLASEETPYGGTIFAAGGVFLSDFEVDADVDDYALPYANRTIAENILDAVTVELPLSTIAEVRAAGMGEVFRIRGYATAGRIDGNAFFDAMYLQDETGGITVFPIAEDGVITIGTPMEIIGYVDAYQGDKEIQIMSYRILDEDPYIWEPEKLSCADAMDYEANGGKLIQVEGVVKEGSIVYNADGTLAQFVVTDGQGGEAKIFIDGYILSSVTGKNELASTVKAGEKVSAIGLLYAHPEGDSDEPVSVLRVRDCEEITVIKDSEPVNPTDPTDPTDPEDPTKPGDPTDPTKPEDSTDPTKPGEPTDPSKPTTPADSTSPKTGDDFPLVPLILLLVLAAAGIVVMIIYKKRQK